MNIHLTEKNKFLIVPSFPAGVAKDRRIRLGDHNVEVTTDMVMRKLQLAFRGEFRNLDLYVDGALSVGNCDPIHAVALVSEMIRAGATSLSPKAEGG
jgi:hypothetical protein